ncbi:MAG: hypothetical protein R2690_09635 [Acidimicrobiales bacterium]
MGDQRVDGLARLLDQAPVARGDRAQPQRADLGERVEVDGHVAVGRSDHHGLAVVHVVAGEQHPLLLDEVAQVRRGVAGGVDRPHAELGGGDGVAVGELAVGLHAALGREGQDLGAGAGLERLGAGGVVRVVMGEGDPADAITAAADDGLEVRLVLDGRVDHDHLVDADEVGVGARTGEHVGVGRHDASHHGAQGSGDAGIERLGRRWGVVVLRGHDP